MTKKNILIKYIRDHNRKPLGVIVATSPENIGVAICNPNDRWNKKLAKEIAIGRACTGSRNYWRSLPKRSVLFYNRDTCSYDETTLDHLVTFLVDRMRERAKLYFKESPVAIEHEQ